ncbi:MAG: FAD-binding oxidoreductase [Ectothiorhodospiraceae bacterium]|nr:FAD-binding oxidoreductase [Ectothiorhodospiraceae bacterium]
MAGSGRSIAVVGAGIVGVSSAVWLARDGHRVTLVDRLEPGEGTSYGNAGVLASASIVPVTVPGLWKKAPGMLLDPMAPLFLRWSYLPRLLPWLARYMRHCKPAEVERIAAAQMPLVGDSLEQHQALSRGTPAERWIVPCDYFFVFADRAVYAGEPFGWGIRRRHGFELVELEGAALAEYEPELGPANRFGVRIPGHGRISDPGRYVKDLAAHAETLGAKVMRAEVTGFVRDGERVTGLATGDGPIACDDVVIATGAWSKPLAASLGLDVPLESERGYHIELLEPSFMPRNPTSVTAGKFVITPMEGRVRLAGIVEFGGLDAPPSEAPYRLLLERARAAFPGLTWRGERRWMGHRPSTADSLPLVGPLARHPNVHLAFGHQHLGLTAGPKTGRIVADLIAGRRPNFDLAPYRPERFGG